MSILNDPELEMSISKLRKQVANWPKHRWRHLAIGLICLLWGGTVLYQSLPHLLSDQSILEKLQIDKKPENLATEWWLLAEVRRAVSIFEHRNKMIALALIECVIGIVMVAGSSILLGPTLMRWNDGGREIQNGRLLLMVYDELQQRPYPNTAGDST